MASRDYTISVSFPDGVNIRDLFDDISGTSFSVTPLSVDTIDDILTAHFDGPLSVGDITALDALVASYVYEAVSNIMLSTVAIIKKTVMDTEYRLIGSTFYAGSNIAASIGGLYFNFTKTPDISATNVLLLNSATGEILIEETLNTGGLHRLTTVANVPKKSSTLEVYVKHDGADTDFLTITSIELALSI